MLASLKGKNVFLTGATGGIGRELAYQFARSGCNLFLTGRSRERLSDLADNILSEDNQITVSFQAGDLESSQDVFSLVDGASHSLGAIDILVNCAGSFVVKSLFESSLDDFDKSFNVNVRAPFVFSREFAKSMSKAGWGRIINIGSSSSYSGFSDTSLYCSSKHALLGLSRAFYDELKDYNIKTFCFSPGSVKTEMGKKVKNQDFSTFIDPVELAEYIVFTISFDSDMISEELRINRFKIQ
jgi:short-subunit dehydrogenase